MIIFLLTAGLAARFIFGLSGDKVTYDATDGRGQTTGNKEVQADAMDISITSAGKRAVRADGIGKENTGKVCATLAVKEFIEAFSFYKSRNSPLSIMRISEARTRASFSAVVR